MSLIKMLLEAGYPKCEIFHNGLDLEVYDTLLARKVISDFCKQNNWDYLSEIVLKGKADGIALRKCRTNNGPSKWICLLQYSEEDLTN